MSRFTNRYLPRNERRTALWLALGGAGVFVIADVLTSVVFNAATEAVGGADLDPWAIELISMLTAFAIVTILVASLIRLARAPKALALYMIASAAVTGATALASTGAVLPHVGIGLGALGGAWVAETVSLARIRDDGFSGDGPDGEGLSTTRAPYGWTLIGWHGRTPQSDGMIAIAMAAVTVIPAIMGLLFTNAARTFTTPTTATGNAVTLLTTAVAMGGAWVVSAFLVARKSGVHSTWLGVSRMVASVFGGLVLLLAQDFGNAWMDVVSWLVILIAVIGAAFLGVYLAIHREPDTLSPDQSLDAVTPEPPSDSAGPSGA